MLRYRTTIIEVHRSFFSNAHFFGARSIIHQVESSNSLGPVRADSLYDSIASMMGGQLPMGGDPRVTLAILWRRRDALDTLDMSWRIRVMETRLHVDREQ